MDEQRLTARIAAMRQAIPNVEQMTEALIEDRFRLAGAFENWLMRPPPVDVSTVDRPPCDAETTADQLGSERCPTLWQNGGGDDRAHRCRYTWGHEPKCVCACGDVCSLAVTP